MHEELNTYLTSLAREGVCLAAATRSVVAGLQPGYRVVEVGCGTGIVLQQLKQVCTGGEVMGMDLYPEAVEFASRRAGCRVIVGDVLNPPPLGQFDVVGMFDVLEHLPDDRAILRGLNRLLKPGGALVTPAVARRHVEVTPQRHVRRHG